MTTQHEPGKQNQPHPEYLERDEVEAEARRMLGIHAETEDQEK